MTQQTTNTAAYSDIGNERRTWLIVREGLLTVAREMQTLGQIQRSASMALVGRMLYAAANVIADHLNLRRAGEDDRGSKTNSAHARQKANEQKVGSC